MSKIIEYIKNNIKYYFKIVFISLFILFLIKIETSFNFNLFVDLVVLLFYGLANYLLIKNIKVEHIKNYNMFVFPILLIFISFLFKKINVNTSLFLLFVYFIYNMIYYIFYYFYLKKYNIFLNKILYLLFLININFLSFIYGFVNLILNNNFIAS